MSEEMKEVFRKLGCLDLALECEVIDPNTIDPTQRKKLNDLMKIMIDNKMIFKGSNY